ncbi:HEAT repeat domain-containing protein [bacterium]|nr:HEAT repeat domain-containing protein [bacterium]
MHQSTLHPYRTPPHSANTILRLSGLSLLLLCCLATGVLPARAELEGSENNYGAYTLDELNALEQALNAGNMTLADLQFDKDYAKGHGCFPIIREMMADPLQIAQWMDKLAAAGRLDSSGMQRMLINADSLANTEHNSDWVSPGPITPPASREEIIAKLLSVASALPQQPDELREQLRGRIVSSMAWHDIENSSTEDSELPEPTTELYELLIQAELRPDYHSDSLYAFAAMLSRLDPHSELFPQDHYVVMQTPLGQMAIGTPYDDHYSGDFAILIDPAGNDTYTNCRIGAAFGSRSYGPRLGPDGEPSGASADFSPLGDGRFGFFADLSGDDLYDCGDTDITLGAAVLGNAAFFDFGGGDDRYYAGSISLGAAMCGIASFYDDGGSDTYSSKVFSQGAAAFGTGIMYDDAQGETPAFDIAEGNEKEIDAFERSADSPDILSAVDNDTYSAWSESQAFARTRGVALCINTRGNEVYEAGGVYLHAPLFGDRYQSFSQGFAIGERDIDYAGGIAMLIDYEGNDRYLGDIYNQGVGYWYSGGFLWDGAGNDLYEMTQYGQGSGIHLAVGGLVDVAGSDTYVMHSGLGQGGSHDFAASILHDRGGDDRYFGNTSCNGTGLTNSVGIHIDRSGNDTYASRKDGGLNAGRPARNSASIGVLVDLAGTDSYLADGNQADSSMWSNSRYGVGWDIAPPPDAAETASTSGPNQPPGEDVEMPVIIAYEGELTQEVFDELWAIAIRWEVGENVAIVPESRKRIVAFGMPVLPYVVAEMDDDYSLAVRAFNDIYPQLMELDRPAVLSALRDAADTDVFTQRNCVLRVIGDLKLSDLGDVVTEFLEDPQLRRRAIQVLGMIGSHAADAELLAMLADPATDEKDLQAAVVSAAALELDCGSAFLGLLDHQHVSVRDCVSGQLRAHWEQYGGECLAMLGKQALLRSGSIPPDRSQLASTTQLRCVLRMLQTLEDPPSTDTVESVILLIGDKDWGVRGDSTALHNKWQDQDNPDAAEALAQMKRNLDMMIVHEHNPYVLNVWQQGQ